MKRLLKLFLPIALVLVFVGYSNGIIPKGLINDIESIAAPLIDKVQQEDLEKDEVLINRVVDGDTVNLQFSNGKEETIRLLLIDTPESVHASKPVQKYGMEASDYAKETL